MKGTELTDQILCQAVAEMEKGLIDADLGGGVVKKRVALPGRGKSGSIFSGNQTEGSLVFCLWL
jgi:hypothetical protein